MRLYESYQTQKRSFVLFLWIHLYECIKVDMHVLDTLFAFARCKGNLYAVIKGVVKGHSFPVGYKLTELIG